MIVVVTREPGIEWLYYDFLKCINVLVYSIHSQLLVLLYTYVCIYVWLHVFAYKYDYM